MQEHEFLAKVQNTIKKTINAEKYKTAKLIIDAMTHSIGGKLLRPKLVLASFNTFKANNEKTDINKAILIASAIELVHSYSLVHDDIMDNDEYRRGEPSVWKKFGTNNAILAGNYLLQLGIQVLLQSNNMELVFMHFNNSIKSMLTGQVLDINGATGDNVMELKTGALFKFCAMVGGIVSNSPESEINRAKEFGYNFGIMYQKKDDIEDKKADFILNYTKIDFCDSIYFKKFMENVFK